MLLLIYGVHSDQDLPFRSRKSDNKMSVDLEQNIDEKIRMNPLITIGIPRPHITRTRLIKCDIFDLVIMDSPCHGTMNIEGYNLL